jgi:uncharacterized membrane protein
MAMWFYLALYFALWTAVFTVLVKKLTKTIDPLVFLLITYIFYIPLAFLCVLFTGGIPQVAENGYVYMVIAGVLDALAFIASTIAIKRSSISLLAPISSFNPVFTTLFAIVGLGEIPTLTKWVGIIIIVIGAYLLNIQVIKEGMLMPFKKLFTDKAVQLFLFANVIWGLTPIFQKQSLLTTTPHAPLFVSLIGFFVMTLSILPFVYKKVSTIPSFVLQNHNAFWFLLIAVGGVSSTAAAFTVFSLTNVGYATAVFKLSVLFTVVGGALFFKEKNIKQRLIASVVMLLGTMLLLL